MPHEGVCPTTAPPTTLLGPFAAEQPMCLTHVSWEGTEFVHTEEYCDLHCPVYFRF